jgi:hypothetical protein
LPAGLLTVAVPVFVLVAGSRPQRSDATFLDATGTLHITPGGVTCKLNLRNEHPVLIDAGFADLEVSIPWRDGQPKLNYRTGNQVTLAPDRTSHPSQR